MTLLGSLRMDKLFMNTSTSDPVLVPEDGQDVYEYQYWRPCCMVSLWIDKLFKNTSTGDLLLLLSARVIH